jgi:hypothetical protein
MARPRASPWKWLPRMARLFGIKSAAPISLDTPAGNEPRDRGRQSAQNRGPVNMPKPITKYRRRPK